MTMPIALTYDDNFWAPAFATMRSVCLVALHRQELKVHLFHRTLTPGHKADLEATRDEFPARQPRPDPVLQRRRVPPMRYRLPATVSQRGRDQ